MTSSARCSPRWDRCSAGPANTRLRGRRCAPNCGRSARSRRRRSTTSAGCRSRCTRRFSTKRGSRGRWTGIFRQWSGSSVSPYRMSDRRPLPPVGGEIGIQVYRVLQEALNNVARHSGRQRGEGASATRRRCPRSSKSRITERGSPPTLGPPWPWHRRHARARGARGRHDRVLAALAKAAPWFG